MKGASTIGIAVIVDVERKEPDERRYGTLVLILNKAVTLDWVWFLLSRYRRSWDYIVPIEVSGNMAVVEMRGPTIPHTGDLLVYKHRRKRPMLTAFSEGRYDKWINRVLNKFKLKPLSDEHSDKSGDEGD